MNEEGIIVIGAGMAGLVAAIKLSDLGYACTIFDQSLPAAKDRVGGFAKFSGAKFSLPPAGMGLLEVCNSESHLNHTIQEVIILLGLDKYKILGSSDISTSKINGLRKYDSIVLTPQQIDLLILSLEKEVEEISTIQIIKSKAEIIKANDDGVSIRVSSENEDYLIHTKTVFYAGGRQDTSQLINAGLESTTAKGIDLGVRIEFHSNEGLANLRQLGPDAKIIENRCRTFCLNVPGHIYRYPFENISIPGGVVASQEHKFHNVGILHRSLNKDEALGKIRQVVNSLPREIFEKVYEVKGSALGETEGLLNDLYGREVVSELLIFCESLQNRNLIDWNHQHYVHLPLIDWHWDTFSQAGTFKTNVDSVYCIGDISGHARGLLQAAASGWLAAEEYSNAHKY